MVDVRAVEGVSPAQLDPRPAIDPANPQALRMAIQVSGVLQDRTFADNVLEMMRAHNPAALPLAESFIKDAFGGQKPKSSLGSGIQP